MRTPRSKHSTFLILVWVINIAGGLALSVFFLWYSGPAARAAGPATDGPVPYQSPTPIPTRYYLPTVTPNSHYTQVALAPPTAFVLPNGQAPAVIGYSVSKRPIEVYTFGQGEKQRMIVAGIHGGYEWNTVALVDGLITYLADHPQVIPSDVTLFIVRNLNPDGDARDHGIEGRVNDHGVDLNRNFPVNWSSTWDREGCFDQAPTTSGAHPASEPETRILMNFLSNHKVQALISYHSAGLGVFPGGEPWDESSIRLAQQLAGVSPYPFPPILTGCVYNGTLADFAVSRGITAVDMELSDHEHTDFTINLRVLRVLLEFDP